MKKLSRRNLLATASSITVGCVQSPNKSESTVDPAELATATNWPMTGYDSHNSSAVNKLIDVGSLSVDTFRSIGTDIFSPVIVGEKYVSVSGENTAIAINRKNPESLTNVEPPGNVGGAGYVSDELVALPRDPVGSGVTGDSAIENPLLYAYDPATGEDLWSVKLPGERMYSATATDRLNVLTDAGVTTVTKDGEREWTYQFEQNQDNWDQLLAPMRPAVDGTSVITPCTKGVCKVNIGEDSPIWTTEMAGLRHSPVVTNRGEVIISSRNKTIALDNDTGDVQWSIDQGTLHAPAIMDSTLVGSFGGSLTALDATSGDQRWRRDAGTLVQSPAIIGSVVVSVDNEHSLRLFDIESGDKLAKTDPDGQITSFAPTTAGQYVITQHGEEYKIELVSW